MSKALIASHKQSLGTRNNPRFLNLSAHDAVKRGQTRTNYNVTMTLAILQSTTTRRNYPRQTAGKLPTLTLSMKNFVVWTRRPLLNSGCSVVRTADFVSFPTVFQCSGSAGRCISKVVQAVGSGHGSVLASQVQNPKRQDESDGNSFYGGDATSGYHRSHMCWRVAEHHGLLRCCTWGLLVRGQTQPEHHRDPPFVIFVQSFADFVHPTAASKPGSFVPKGGMGPMAARGPDAPRWAWPVPRAHLVVQLV